MLVAAVHKVPTHSPDVPSHMERKAYQSSFSSLRVGGAIKTYLWCMFITAVQAVLSRVGKLSCNGLTPVLVAGDNGAVRRDRL